MPRHSGGAVGLAAEAEGSIAFQILGQKLAGGFKLLADHSEAVEPGAHGELRIVHLAGDRARGPDLLGLGGEREAELDEHLELASVDAVLLAIRRPAELKKSQLYGPMGKDRVIVKLPIPT